VGNRKVGSQREVLVPVEKMDQVGECSARCHIISGTAEPILLTTGMND
jgi:hypothetical protein